jgi:CBS domain-containing protein
MADWAGFPARLPEITLQRGDDSALPAPGEGRSITPVTGKTGRLCASPANRRGRNALIKRRNVVMQVRHILHTKGRDVVAIAVTATLCDAAKILTEKRIGALIVKDAGGAVAGIISERDLVHAIAARGCDALNDTVAAHMTSGLKTCVESDTVETVMEVMSRGRFRHVPVMDHGDRLCGMISIGDVVKTRIAETVSEAAALRDYISAAV